MGSVITTPRSKWHIAALAGVLWLLVPIVEAAYYYVQERRGAYPTNADSIAIPIYFFTIAWAVVSPLFVLLAWLVIRTYRGGLDFRAFDSSRPVRSVVTSLVWGGLAIWCVYNVSDSAVRGSWVDALFALPWIYLFLCLRSSAAGGQGATASQSRVSDQA